MGDDFEYRIQRLRLEPGDMLVIKLNGQYPPEAIDRMAKSFREHVGADIKMIMVGHDIDLSVLTRAEIESRV